jgi:molybdopterin converting factor small subunit
MRQMPVEFRIPTILRSYTSGASVVSVEPADPTLGSALAALEGTFPGILARVLDDTGALRRFVNLYVGEEDVRFERGLDTPTPSGSIISIIPAVAGG